MKPPPPPPPRPWRRGKRSPAIVKPVEVKNGKVRVTRSVEVDLGGASLRARAKLVGMMEYVRNPGLSLRQVWQQTPLDSADPGGLLVQDVVTDQQFRSWAHDGRWSSYKKALWADVEHRVLEAIAGETVRKELTEIDGFEKLREDAVSRLKDTEPKSFEGVLNAVVTLDKHIVTKRDRISTALAQHAAAGAPALKVPEDAESAALPEPLAPDIGDSMTDEDFMRMARAVAEGRVLEGQPAAPEDEEQDDDG